MSELEDKLGAVLSDPKMMQQIMSMAQALGGSSPAPAQKPPEACPPAVPGLDPGILRSLAGIAQKSGADANQKALLSALCPYLSQNKLGKLERAMRAAKLAGLASGFLNSGGLQLLTGR